MPMGRRISGKQTIVALAGRRVDAPSAPTPRFPTANVDIVRERLRLLFRQLRTEAIVCSAACGSDLLALDVACEMNIERHIVLPYDKARFRADSVTDRPGDWGPLFDRMCEEVEDRGQLLVMNIVEENQIGWDRANVLILDTAVDLASAANASSQDKTHSAVGVVVWDGIPWGEADITAGFARLAKQRGLRLIAVSSL